LNLGRQLFWQQKEFTKAFAHVTDILMYPQYWAWRLSGQLRSEVTSLACHTDLWSPRKNDYSSLVWWREGWSDKFPEIVPAWTDLGQVKAEIREQTGLSENCRVFTGVHDSNASFLRYRTAQKKKPFAVISTGTWLIVMATDVSLAMLDNHRDMLANADIFGHPVACSRSMGGREFATICKLVGAQTGQAYTETDLQSLIDTDVMALPDFSGGSGPFRTRTGRISGECTSQSGVALASLYCALMLDYQLDLLHASGDIFIEGVFLKNKLCCGVLTQLRRNQKVHLSSDDTGTVKGCAFLAHWEEKKALNISPATATQLKGLFEYRDRWRITAE
jgi:sugar (pentulose or hexulose) kinase